MPRNNAKAKVLKDLPAGISKEEIRSLAESIAKNIIAEQSAEPVKKYRYPELENEHVTVIKFGVDSDAHACYKLLAKEPKVSLFIPVEFGGKELRGKHWHRYQLNGLTLWIDKGVMAEVPKTVYEDMQESMVETEKALNPYVVDGDGRLVPAMMSNKVSLGEFAR